MLRHLLLALLLILSLSACNRDISVQPNIDGTATIVISLTEADVNTAIQTILASTADPLLRDPSVDLQNGQVVVSGEHDRRDGSGRVSGTLTVTLSVQNGTLAAQVTSANIEGLDLSDERIAQFNGALATRLSGRARQDNPRAILDRVTVTDEHVQIQIIVQVSN